MRKLVLVIVLALLFPISLFAAEASCEDLMARLRAGEKIPSGAWWDCLDVRVKEQVIFSTIKLYKDKEGIIIKSPPSYYAGEIDAFRSETPALKGASIKFLLTTIAAMSYDFDEGIPKEETLRKQLIPEHAKKIIAIRQKENTPDGVMPVKMLSGGSVKTSLAEMVKDARGFTIEK